MELKLFSPEVVANPYASYREIAEQGPVVFNEHLNMWMVVGYAEVKEVVSNYHAFSSSAKLAALGPVGALLATNSMASADPPEHTRLRGIVQKAFTPRAIAALEAPTRHRLKALLDGLETGDVLEVVENFAAPMSIDVIAELLGVPEVERPSFKRWSDDLMEGNNPSISTPEDARRAQQAAVELVDYVRELIARRKADPSDDDLVGRIVAANADAIVTEDEMVGSLVLLLFAGHETTTKTIANAVLCLGQYPDQRRRVVDDPALLGPAVEEVLRFDPPPQASVRFVTENLVLGGQQLKKDDLVLFILAAANRDPAEFPDPDRFDVGRNAAHHLAFIHGPHFCIGAALARLEVKLAVETLLAKAPDYRIVGDPEISKFFFMRGVTKLEVQLERTA